MKMPGSLPAPFAIDHHALGEADLIVVVGELDIRTAPGFSRALERLDASEERPVVLDLCDVSFVDSSGLRALVAGQQTLASAGRPLHLACSSAPVRRTLERSGLADRFSIFESRDQAIAAH